MDAISTVTSMTNTTGGTSSTGATPTLGYNQFLKLLIAQMKNQDPTAPSDSTQFVSQLATFSSLEQSVQANAKLESILNLSAVTQAQALIGRTLTSADGSQTGIVQAVDTNSAAPTATLDGGATVALAPGVRIS